MIYINIMLIVLGFAIIAVGLIMFKNKKAEFLHSYHFDKIAEENKPEFSAKVGIGVSVIGLGVFLSGIINYLTKTAWGEIAFIAGIVLGFYLIIKAKAKYENITD